MSIDLTESFLAKAAGWEAMKNARGLVAADRVLSSDWTPPVLKGVVQEGGSSYRAGLVIKGALDIENLCPCRQSRQRGLICAHSVAIGVHQIQSAEALKKSTSNKASPGGAASGSVSGRGASTGASEVLKASGATSVPALRRVSPGHGVGGELAELFLILPPLLAQGAPRGVVMMYFECKVGSKRRPLDVLPRDQEWRFDEADSRLLDQIELLSDGGAPGILQMTILDFNKLLRVLVGHPRVTLGKNQSVQVQSDLWAPPVRARLESDGEISIQTDPMAFRPTLFKADTTWVFTGQTLRPMLASSLLTELIQGPLRIKRGQVPKFLSQDWPVLALTPGTEANFELGQFKMEPLQPRFLLELAGGLARLQARLQCGYGPRVMTLGMLSDQESLWIADPADPFRYSTRDLASERGALEQLTSSGFTGPDAQGRYLLSGEDGVLRFFARTYRRLQKDWEVTLEERLERATLQGLDSVQPRFEVRPSGEQWFDLHVSYTTSGGDRLAAAEVQRLLRSGQCHTRLKNGKVALLDTGAVEELQEILLDCGPEQRAGGYRISNSQAGFLDASLRAQEAWKLDASKEWRDQVGRQSGSQAIDTPDLGDLKEVLRPYQQQGMAWMVFLRKSGFGGILADEMGLGKTVQTLAYLRVLVREFHGLKERRDEVAGSGNLKRPALIVCPTSLVFNWVAEAARFTPELRVLAIDGPSRQELFDEMSRHDLVVTSYALLRRDAERYREVFFDTVILDEAQHIKNRQTQNAMAVKAIRSAHRFVLTGTPLENSVLDVWSIFDFLMPGYLGSVTDFKERYETPITKEKDQAAHTRLARRLRPFMLRRLKRDVVADLPAKIEQVAFCEMSAEQGAIYRQILDAGRKEVMEAAGSPSAGKGRIAALNALLRLRQVCCDPRLLKADGIDPSLNSGKIDLFEELLEEVIDGGHRVLVFSQFVSMLTILRERLEKDSVRYCYLDGGTVDRGDVVARFQQDTAIPVFLISLKAGGVGLNLTGADTVIHFDPWWNPAVEDQATDRAHRIGQSRVVTSYKLITRGTVEEKILSLQGRKRDMIQGLLGSEESLVEALTWDEMKDLLS